MHSVFTFLLLFWIGVSNGKPSPPRAESELRQFNFALAGFSLANQAGGNNIFRQATVTRTVVRTVSTVTAVAFRTCTAPVLPAVLPCAGRRRRDVEGADDNGVIVPSIVVILGSSTMSDQAQVSSILHLRDSAVPSAQTSSPAPLDDPTTLLYPSQEAGLNDLQDKDEEALQVTTDTPLIPDTEVEAGEIDVDPNDNARINLAGTTTVTVTIPVTSVATTFATGTAATLTVSYAGCIPPTLPVSGTACA